MAFAHDSSYRIVVVHDYTADPFKDRMPDASTHFAP
jgi:hypothetical protein